MCSSVYKKVLKLVCRSKLRVCASSVSKWADISFAGRMDFLHTLFSDGKKVDNQSTTSGVKRFVVFFPVSPFKYRAYDCFLWLSYRKLVIWADFEAQI